MKRTLRSITGAVSGAALVSMLGSACLMEEVDDLGQLQEELYVQNDTIWASGKIPVCWDNPSSSNEVERGWVRDQVTRTWERAAAIDFTGWGTCAGSARGIRIEIRDQSSPPSSRIGNKLDGVAAGMRLNFTFSKWDGVGDPADSSDGSCADNEARREQCIRNIAVHEFGHALGFRHEQDRKDTPQWCINDQNGSAGGGLDGATNWADWDEDSVMNYCNSTWNNGGVLSAADISGARAYYPGNVHTHAINSNGSVGSYVELFEWTDGWDTSEFFQVGGKTYLLLLKSSDGRVHIHQIGSDGRVGARVTSYAWSGGWTSAQFFVEGTTTYLFLLKESTGDVHIHRMNTDGSVGTRVAKYKWSWGWSSVKTARIGSTNYLLLLKEGTGDIHIHQLNSNGSVGTNVFDSKWSTGWTTAELYTVGNATYLFLLKADTGVVHINRMNFNGSVGSIVKSYEWSKGWTSASFYYAAGKTYLLLLKKGTGDVHAHVMNYDGTVGTSILDSKWRKGWSNAEPYMAGGKPHMFLLMDNQ